MRFKASTAIVIDEREASLLNKGSRLAEALGVTRFITVLAMTLVTLCCVLKSELDVQQTCLRIST